MNNYPARPSGYTWEWFLYLHKDNLALALADAYRTFGYPGRHESTPFACSLDDAPYCRLTCGIDQFRYQHEARTWFYGTADRGLPYCPHPLSLYETFFTDDRSLYNIFLLLEQQQEEEAGRDFINQIDERIERNYREGLNEWLFIANLSLLFMLFFLFSFQANNLLLASFSLINSLFLWLAAYLTRRAF
jgi:hypothetical protein